MVGKGSYMTTEGYARKIVVFVQGYPLNVAVCLLPVSGTDALFWFWALLGPHDHQELNLGFFQDDKFVTLQGETTISPQPAQYHRIRRLHQANAIKCSPYRLLTPCHSKMRCCNFMKIWNPSCCCYCKLINVFFSKPVRLPPARAHDHSILSMDESKLVKVKPYRYPHSQKEAI